MPRAYHMELSAFNHHHHHHNSVLQRLGLEPHFFQLQSYLRYTEPLELSSPLDLSLKNHHSAPITPPCTPSPSLKRHRTPSPITTTIKQQKTKLPSGSGKKSKTARKLNFEEADNSSPVSGTIIRELRPDENLVVRKGDIDPAFNVVEITDEAKAELAKIENIIGEYVCRLCKELYEDAFGLAQHRCSRIVHVEYRCPECDKVFNCPANLASHRRWHKPRQTAVKSLKEDVEEDGSIGEKEDADTFECRDCGKKFRRVAYLRKHQMAVHQQD